ncbi:threonine dehydratase [Maritimibacter alkaliphilus HTCC2654]|uniref:L-serine dehydratase n=1 Tax=Maritimibacter alkaliphilus HTCC2654 TaxID=314271 RepID=A3VFZ4_9RHOB|nr:threonine ammonia-lyase [Maritimibacter alkaliphilus]EAQ12770.1 threonine dehydratase [Rhodobacterales bacterium HTCC2654] [Maritimibacter alkaliphilus HTCC2654]TYP78727.1 threonine dehydratase [Maritimibacter alkaliphilus HTCC2654]
MTLTYDDVLTARAAIADATLLTPTVPATRLSLQLGIDLHLKLENLQHTNAFKARGALAKLLSLTDEERRAGVIACSAGNHAQGVAYHATRLGITSVIVMPHGTPFNKIKRTQDFGATVELHGKTFEEAMEATREMMARDGLVLIHPFDDPILVAGQGTVACEMLEQEPDLDVIVVPIGGGGLIAGIATAAKAIKPEVQVIGAQAELFDAVKSAIDGTAPHFKGASLAEGIAVKAPSPANVEVIRRRVDRIESVTEEQIEAAVFDLLSHEKIVAEGAAGAGLAVVQKLAGELQGKKVGLVVCGGNIDSRILSTLILRGLVRDGRIARLTFEIDDTPGQLAVISRMIGEAGANVVEVIHQRMFQSVALKQAELEVVIEARDKLHVLEIVADLRAAGFNLTTDLD